MLLQNMTKLTELSLSYVDIQASVPSNLSSSLTIIDLRNTNLHGTFPYHIFQLPNVHQISLRGNDFDGPIELITFSNVVNLEYLNLALNNFSGPIQPKTFSNLVNLKYLDLATNNFTGPIEIDTLVNLSTLDLSSNSFGTTLDIKSISSLKSIQTIDLSYSSLTLIKEDNTTLPMISIDILRLGSCNISDLDILRLIVVQNEVYLPNNNIHGELPEWVWSNWSNITALSLSNNFITHIGNKIPLQNLLYLYLGSNFLKGQLPILPHFITELDLSNNQFHGEIKPSICRLTIYFLDLSNNSLNEALPHCFWMMSSPTVLDLHMNNFQGTIPHTFFMNNLQDLNLRGNNFEGEVPRSLINCSSLEFLDLSENNFTDTFPIWFGDFPRLRVLSLRSNKFHGPVSLSHASTFAFSNLQILDLSYNQFTGNLPPTLFLRLQKMTRVGITDYMHYFGDSYPINSELANDHTPSYHDSLTMVLNGNIMPFDRIAELMVSMDLSCNHFEGEIPNSIGGLIAIRQLSLAHNNFTGHIPPQLGDLSNLQSLDLSCNQLDGNIPDKFAALGFLRTMNLSYNHLTGQIPSGRLLQVIPNNSYIGNDGLCGFPLSRSCENLEPSPHGGLPNEEDDEEFFDGLTWQSVVMGYCVGICIGLVIGSLILVTGKPKWLVRMIEEEAYRIIRRYKGRNGISMTWNMRS